MLSCRSPSVTSPVAVRPVRRSAAHTVEFAVVSVVFFITIFCIIEMCRVLMVCHLLNEAARRGCRAIIVEGTSNTTAQTAVDNYLSASGVSGYTTTVQVNDAVANA